MAMIEEIRGALARGYCAEGQTHKVMDPDLCEAQAREVMAVLGAGDTVGPVEELPDCDRDPHSEFAKELADLINRHSMESRTDTPDFILATFLVDAMRAYEVARRTSSAWWGEAQSKWDTRPNPTTTQTGG